MNRISNPIRLYAASLAIAVAGVFAASAFGAADGPSGHGPMGTGHGPMMGTGHGPMMGAGHGPMMQGHGPMMDGMLPRLLDRVNATPEQRAKIKQIVDAGANEIRSQHESGRTLREQALSLFAQPTVDADALEALRQKQLALHDEASKRFTTAMLEVSRVLSPEQRKQMAEQMVQRREMMRRHRNERQSLDAAKG